MIPYVNAPNPILIEHTTRLENEPADLSEKVEEAAKEPVAYPVAVANAGGLGVLGRIRQALSMVEKRTPYPASPPIESMRFFGVED